MVALGLPSAGLPSPHAGTHWEVPLASTPNCSDASWQLRSHPGGALSRSVSRSCAFISGSVVKNKAFQYIKYPFGKRERKAPSPSCVSGCSGQALGEPLPHSNPCGCPWANLGCCGKRLAEASQPFVLVMQQLHRLSPCSRWAEGWVATCPGFAQWSWLLRTWICNWAWTHSVLLLGNPKVALIAEQQRQILGTRSPFPNGEVRNWMKNCGYIKGEKALKS